jgi:Holliday junction DNA helicase RuvB
MNENLDDLRPKSLSEFQGQDDLKKELDIILNSAKMRKKMPDHILFSGPPGLG